MKTTRPAGCAGNGRTARSPLTILEAPYRDPHRPLPTYVKRLHATNPQTVIMVFIPEYVVTKWWLRLHDLSALRFKARLLFTPGVVVVDVPYHLGVGDQGWLGTRRRSAATSPTPTPPSDAADLSDVTTAAG